MKRLAISIIGLFIGLSGVLAQVPVKWQKTYGEGLYNSGSGIIQTEDGGYVILSNSGSEVGNTKIHLVKIDTLGIIQWERILNNTDLKWASDFKQTSDKGFIITGSVYTTIGNSYDLLLIKTDSAGNTEWEKEVGGASWDFGQTVLITPDAAFLSIGKTYSYGAGDADVYIVKTNFAGDTLWTRTFGGDSLDFGTSGDIAPDSNYMIAANTRSFGHGDLDAWILKLNTDGDSLWSCFYGDTLEDCVNSFRTTPDKGFVFVGYTRSYGAQLTETWLMRYDSNYNYIWKLPEFWNIGPGEDVANSVTLNDSAQYVISGYTTGAGHGGREMFVAIIGDINFYKYGNTFGTPEDEEATMAFQTRDKGYLISGYTAGFGPANTNVYVIKTGSNAVTEGTCDYTVGTYEISNALPTEILVYPNPTSDFINVQLNPSVVAGKLQIILYDISGRTLQIPAVNGSPSSGQFSVDLRSLTSGLYFLDMRCDGKRWTTRVILQH